MGKLWNKKQVSKFQLLSNDKEEQSQELFLAKSIRQKRRKKEGVRKVALATDGAASYENEDRSETPWNESTKYLEHLN